MNGLDGFLARFKKVFAAGVEEREAVAAAVFEQTGVQLTHTEIEIRGGDITIVGSPGLKSKIFISQARILASLESKFPKKFRSIR